MIFGAGYFSPDSQRQPVQLRFLCIWRYNHPLRTERLPRSRAERFQEFKNM